MYSKLTLLFASVSILSLVILVAQEDRKVRTMNLKAFMEDYVEPAANDYEQGKKDKLIQLLQYTPNLAPEKDKEEWKKIIDEHIGENTPLKSCKSCHSKFKKEYKQTYRKKLLEIPTELIE